MSCAEDGVEPCRWYVLRDLTRSNARRPAYKLLSEHPVRVFTPMTRKSVVREGRRLWEEVPFLHDLVFAYGTRGRLDPIIGKTPTLQYRFMRGGYGKVMTVPTAEMERFIRAVEASSSPRFFRPEEITSEMYGRRVRILGGALDGYEGPLLSSRGTKVKRLLVELPNFLTAAVEVQPDLIEMLK